MCPMSPTQHHPTVPLECALQCVRVSVRVERVAKSERLRKKTKVPRELAVVVLGLVSELESVGLVRKEDESREPLPGGLREYLTVKCHPSVRPS